MSDYYVNNSYVLVTLKIVKQNECVTYYPNMSLKTFHTTLYIVKQNECVTYYSRLSLKNTSNNTIVC